MVSWSFRHGEDNIFVGILFNNDRDDGAATVGFRVVVHFAEIGTKVKSRESRIAGSTATSQVIPMVLIRDAKALHDLCRGAKVYNVRTASS